MKKWKVWTTWSNGLPLEVEAHRVHVNNSGAIVFEADDQFGYVVHLVEMISARHWLRVTSEVPA